MQADLILRRSPYSFQLKQQITGRENWNKVTVIVNHG
jgi:hypothetical protein